MDKRGFELSFQTIAVLILVVLVIVLLIISFNSEFSKLLDFFGGFFQ